MPTDAVMERNATRPDPDRMARLIGFADRGILLADDMFTIVEANPHALAVYGYGHDEIVGMPIGALFGDETGYREAIEGTDHRRGSVFHACHRRKDGRLFPVEISLNNLELDGRVYRQAVIRDLAERAHAEDALRRMNRTLIALAQCNEVLAYGESEEEILTEICRIVVDAGYRFAWVGYAEADEDRSVRPVAQYGYEDGYLDHIQLTWADNERGHGPTGTAIRTARPSCIRNIADHENFRPWRDDALQRGYASCLAIPITLDGTVIGALTVHAARVDAFDEDEIRLLEELAGKLSWGISIQRHRAERERTAAQLRSSEERYRNLFARAKVAQILLNPEDGVIVDANEAAVAYYGYSADELRGQSIGLINIADAPDIQTDLGRACHGQRHQFHFQHRLASGEIREVEVYSGPVEIGGQILLYSIVHDITDRVRIAEALRDSEERYHTLVRTAPTGIYRTDAAGCPVYVSRRWCELAGIPPEESADDGWLRAVHPEDRARVTDLWHRCLAARTDFEAEYRMGRADGPSTWVSCSAKPEIDAAGSFSGYIGAVQDISRIKKLEDQLRQALLDEQEASRQLQEAMASLSNAQQIAAFGNWDWDLETGNTWWSDGVYRLSGMQRREPAPTVDGLMQVIHPADRFRVWESFQDSLTNGAPLDIDYRVIWPDGTVRVLHSVGEATSDAGGRPVRMSGVIQDVTAQRTAEAEIGKLSTVVAQTPLSVLITDTSGRIEYVIRFPRD
jgi:PAS domain S-box-containing protein